MNLELELFHLFFGTAIKAYIDPKDENTIILRIPNPSEIKTKEEGNDIKISGKFEGLISRFITANGYFGIDKKGDEIKISYTQWHKSLDDMKFVQQNGEIKVKGRVLEIKTENNEMIAKIYVEEIKSVGYPWEFDLFNSISFQWDGDYYIFNKFITRKNTQMRETTNEGAV